MTRKEIYDKIQEIEKNIEIERAKINDLLQELRKLNISESDTPSQQLLLE